MNEAEKKQKKLKRNKKRKRNKEEIKNKRSHMLAVTAYF